MPFCQGLHCGAVISAHPSPICALLIPVIPSFPFLSRLSSRPLMSAGSTHAPRATHANSMVKTALCRPNKRARRRDGETARRRVRLVDMAPHCTASTNPPRAPLVVLAPRPREAVLFIGGFARPFHLPHHTGPDWSHLSRCIRHQAPVLVLIWLPGFFCLPRLSLAFGLERSPRFLKSPLPSPWLSACVSAICHLAQSGSALPIDYYATV